MKKDFQQKYLHLNLSTSLPSHNIDRAAFTDNTRILPIPLLKRENYLSELCSSLNYIT